MEFSGNFFLSSDPCSCMIRYNGTFEHVNLTLHTKECKLPLAHMLTEYRVTVTQTSNCC